MELHHVRYVKCSSMVRCSIHHARITLGGPFSTTHEASVARWLAWCSSGRLRHAMALFPGFPGKTLYRLILYTQSEGGTREPPSPDACPTLAISKHTPAGWTAGILRQHGAAVKEFSHDARWV
jgi:hypothetical protein